MGRKIRNLAILGSTGSIGRQTLDIVRAFPDRLKVVGLAAGRNTELLAHQLDEFHPGWAHLEDGKQSSILKGKAISLDEMACLPEVDIVVVATTGKAGLTPTLAAVRAGKTVALANKEVLVMGGALIMGEARRYGAKVLPIDSEHSAIWQCLRGEKTRARRILLTASGGPFRSYNANDLSRVTAADALKHPVWQMGPKVTIDSATLMNKGMEVIEAHWLFGFSWDNIQVVLHPQSIVHSLVEFRDGSLKAQLGPPDMRLPIQYALSYPERWTNQGLPKLRWDEPFSLNFETPDFGRFPCLRLAIEAGKAGGLYPAVLSAADDAAVELFLTGRIGFNAISKLVETALGSFNSGAPAGLSNEHVPTLSDILEAEAFGRAVVKENAGVAVA